MRTACPAPCRCHARNRQDTAQQECRLTTARDEGKNVFSFRGSDHCSALQSMVVRSERLELSRVLPHSDSTLRVYHSATTARHGWWAGFSQRPRACEEAISKFFQCVSESGFSPRFSAAATPITIPLPPCNLTAQPLKARVRRAICDASKKEHAMPADTATPTDTPTVQIDIVSDVMCPWCIVGYKQLEQALGAVGVGAFCVGTPLN